MAQRPVIWSLPQAHEVIKEMGLSRSEVQAHRARTLPARSKNSSLLPTFPNIAGRQKTHWILGDARTQWVLPFCRVGKIIAASGTERNRLGNIQLHKWLSSQQMLDDALGRALKSGSVLATSCQPSPR